MSKEDDNSNIIYLDKTEKDDEELIDGYQVTVSYELLSHLMTQFAQEQGDLKGSQFLHVFNARVDTEDQTVILDTVPQDVIVN